MPDENMPPADGDLDSSYATPEKAAEQPKETETVDEENASGAEILIAKDKLPSGTKEGDTCTFNVTKDFGDEFSIELVKESAPAADEPTSETLEAETESELGALDTGE
jgi:hypothetical protein